ncbi:DUF2442 domain-containing protein [Bosea lathyri]|jgi:hypothetical protein|uniref:DUF2442 domain-containing protein n=1 Tax=Bosea lathyri TaxID=1036778 RepID=A0A1H5WZ26_9HYPH|nr:DUF2442 domain-containing protein [Bosea lathyri]SEG04772.1 Protein of unknown function [Bosea lathyri]
MIELIKLIEVRALEHPRLWLKFSDGREGVRDLSDLLTEGGAMVEPLRDPAMFARVFVQFGVPTWPNGFDLDAMALHDEMARAGLLSPPRAA